MFKKNVKQIVSLHSILFNKNEMSADSVHNIYGIIINDAKTITTT